MKKLLSVMSILLMLSMILTMAGCNKTEASDPTDPNASASPNANGTSAVQTIAQQTGYGYVATYDTMPEGYDNIGNFMSYNGRYYFISYNYDDNTGESTSSFVSMNADGTDVQTIPLPETQFNSNVNNMKFDKDGNIWYIMYEYYYPTDDGDSLDVSSTDVIGGSVYIDDFGNTIAESQQVVTATSDGEAAPDEEAADDEPEVVDNTLTEQQALAIAAGDTSVAANGDYYEAYILYKCDSQGNVLLKKDLSELKGDEDYFYINNMTIDSDGYVYLLYDTNVFVLNPEGELDFKVTSDNWFDSLCPAPDGSIVCTYYGQNGYTCCKIDKTSKAFGASIDLGSNGNYNIMDAGASGYDLLLNDNGNALYGYDMASGEITPILNWLDCDINGSNVNSLYALTETSFMLLSYDDATGQQMITTLDRVPVSEIPSRTIITYAYCSWLDYNVRNAILSFNRQNGTYRISTIDYSQYNTDDDYMAGATKLSNDIIAGNVPDIIDCNNMSMKPLEEKGVLMDLYTLMDNDSEVTRDSFIDGILANQETDGKLYSLASSFYIQTTMGLSSVVGDYPGWNFDEMMAAYKGLGDGAQIMRYMTRDSFLSYCLSMSYNNYIDPDTGECHFDSDDFINMLELSNTFPKEYDYDAEETYVNELTLLAQHKVLLTSMYLSGFSDLDYYRAYLQGQDYTFVGMPSSTKNGHIISYNNQLAASATTASADGIWQFMKYLLSDEYQENNLWNFSVKKSIFETQKQKAMEKPYYTDENGEKVYYENTFYMDDGTGVTVEPMTDAEVQKILDLISNASGSYVYDETINGIITEESASFFDGKKSAQEVASLIQNRVQTYVMESR